MKFNQKGITIVEILVVLAILSVVFVVFLSLFTNYNRRESLNQAAHVFTADIIDILNDIRIGSYPFPEGIECFVYDNRAIYFRDNARDRGGDNLSYRSGQGDQCQYIGKAVLLGSSDVNTDNNARVGGCDKAGGTVCLNNPNNHAQDYRIYNLIAGNIRNDTGSIFLNFKDLEQMLVLNHQTQERLYYDGRYVLDHVDTCREPDLYPSNTYRGQVYRLEYDNQTDCEANPPDGTWVTGARNFDTSDQRVVPNGAQIITSYVWNDANNDDLLNVSEDVNGDGILDAGEDVNGNGILDVNDELASVAYIDGFAVINEDFGIITSNEGGFFGGSRNIQIIALYEEDTKGDPERNRPRIGAPTAGTDKHTVETNQFIENLERYCPVKASVVLPLSGSPPTGGVTPSSGVHVSNNLSRPVQITECQSTLRFPYYHTINSPIIICLSSGQGDEMRIVQVGSRNGVITAEPDFDPVNIEAKCLNLHG